MATFDTVVSQRRWDRLIKRHGDRGALRRQDGGDRAISVSVQQESAMERIGQVSNPLDRIAIVSPLDPDTGAEIMPPTEKDVLVVTTPEGQERLLKIVAPADSMGASVRTMYYRLKVRR